MSCPIVLPPYSLVQPTRKSVSTTEQKGASWQDIQSGPCYYGVFPPPVLPLPPNPLKRIEQMSGGRMHKREGSWDSCPWPLGSPNPSVLLFVLRNRRGASPWWAVTEQTVGYTCQWCRSRKMDPRAEIGRGSQGLSSRGEGLPAGPGPTNVTVGRAGTLAGFSYPSKDPVLQGVRWSGFTFERSTAEKATSKSEKDAQHTSLNSVFCNPCSLFIPPSAYLHLIPKVPSPPSCTLSRRSPCCKRLLVQPHPHLASLGASARQAGRQRLRQAHPFGWVMWTR